MPLPERCRPSGLVYHTTSARGFLHSSERNLTPTKVQDRHAAPSNKERPINAAPKSTLALSTW